ncbi:hypothetical protein [Sphingobacterium wenxiniae]|uniref:Uncharacterized protein n=1 Tax=Sphingobacterium wenxiniae TaxID=683125 RepID=A0A1I6V7B4_9SPHI|nr:hypothetical protein [Sphingobacterium wenxiniae]SFT09556.1 hypothetical protein SAMN05660206_111124 [Sphingobacterium wenxiniae]
MTQFTLHPHLHGIAQFSLFVSSYLPLFLLLIARQISVNNDYLYWGGISWESVKLFGAKFGLSAILLFFSAVGAFGYWKTLANIEEVAKNGNPVTVTDVKNKNSESIGYIATYLIPFLFQNFDNWYECVSVIFLLLIIYRIYINSSLLLINPLLSFRFGIYEIEYTTQNGKNRNGLIISRDKSLQDDCKVKLYEIGHKLYFATINNPNK